MILSGLMIDFAIALISLIEILSGQLFEFGQQSRASTIKARVQANHEETVQAHKCLCVVKYDWPKN